MVVLEAMAFGLPVIVSRIGALIDIIKEGENGFFVEAGNVESIVDKMEYVINHKDILQTISLNNMNYVRKEFNITKIVRQFEEIIIKAMQNV
jgi:glycosyltransferase involved in cell wall biosynthesis